MLESLRFSAGLHEVEGKAEQDLRLRANYHYVGNDNRNHGIGLSLAVDL